MSKGLLPEHIGPLVDRLRAGDHKAVSLPDVAALTEVLMRSLESYFKSIDLTIYAECQSLADYIDDARLEISSLSPDHENSAGIPRAGLELEAIVQQTESATNTIMESAESIMEADSSDMEAYSATVNDAVMKIFEACSFQDITGQRISKVVSTLEHVEDRVGRLINILGVMENSQNTKEELSEEEALLRGPALEGEGIDQSEIDALLNGQAGDVEDGEMNSCDTTETPAEEQPVAVDTKPVTVAEDTASAADDDIDFKFDGTSETAPKDIKEDVKETPEAVGAEEAVPEKAEPDLIEQAKQRKAQAQAEKKAKIDPPKPVVYEQDAKAGLDPKPSENTTQSDIDALFS